MVINKMSNSRKKVLINMSNLHKGGGLQVATSFSNELLKLPAPEYSVKVLISKEIASALDRDEVLSSSWNFQVFNTYGLKTLFSPLRKIEKECDLVFTVFGPKYAIHSKGVDIVGFAQPWIIYPNNPVFNSLSWFNKIKTRLKFAMQLFFFKKAQYCIVELEHVRKSLLDKNVYDEDSISVVHNTISSLYLDKEQWLDIELPNDANEIAIGFVTRDYPHKNISILPSVAELLNKKFGLPVKFYFTLTDQEWSNYKEEFGDYAETVGPISVAQCPRFYEQLDAVIFPSLLECFSATPLEALFMQVPLFASDRDFVKDVCGDYGIYFEPLEAGSIAEVIADYFLGDSNNRYEIKEARNHVLSFSNAEDRAKSYLNVIDQYLEK